MSPSYTALPVLLRMVLALDEDGGGDPRMVGVTLPRTFTRSGGTQVCRGSS